MAHCSFNSYRFIQLVALLFFFTSCAKKEQSPIAQKSSIDYSLNVPSCYTTSSNSPILQSGDLFTGSTWNDPSVLYQNGTYIMFASSDHNFDGDIKIYRLVSSDGITWTRSPTTPVLQKGTSGQWDDHSVETPSVVIFNDTYHMFYTGYKTNSATEFEIGHATSSDGITWTKDPANPLVTSTGGAPVADDFDQFIVAEPGAVVFNGKIYVYFTAQGYITTADDGITINDQLMTIGLITSTDGTTFTAPQRVLDPDQTLFPRSSNWKGYSTPSAVVIDQKMHVYVDVMYTSGSDSQRKLFHVSSIDGINSWTKDSTWIFDRSDFGWTADEIRSPAPLFVNGTIKMWFAGHSGTTLGIGLATCDLNK